MSKFFLLIACILTGLLVLACSAPTNRNAEAPSTASAPVAAGTPSTTTNKNDNTGTVDKVGIAECDNFITAYETCVSSKVPEAARANLRSSVATWRSEWKKLADNPQTRGTLAAACTRQREATMTAMKSYNCAW
jgi:hypothetical protein